ncbi:MAG: Lrp/AsnC ligand binding domain-containing protein [Candidatus Parvarchaeota archaeon]|jgi:DNA-binding Lrp family transcriptional regulator|nr:Lrp/AsnC ligand binding domain-containing protein [Candidatus Parvarchaeota archaeon]MCL5018122.1 Lrp/AsnC ligand binding domain-containing protein [Candidatus Parvarchaeota archaeon]
MEALIFVQILEGSSPLEVSRDISKIEGVTEVLMISGEWDLLVRLKYNNMEDLSSFVVSNLRSAKGVGRTETTIILDKVK